MRHVSGSVSKEQALMFAGYLLGKNRFQPSIKAPEPSAPTPDLVLTLKQRGSQAWDVLGSQGTYTSNQGNSQNALICDLISHAIQAEYEQGMQAIELRTNTYMRDAINKGHINRDREHFARLLFEFMRFKHVTADKER
jgi:hypothetical protein